MAESYADPWGRPLTPSAPMLGTYQPPPPPPPTEEELAAARAGMTPPTLAEQLGGGDPGPVARIERGYPGGPPPAGVRESLAAALPPGAGPPLRIERGYPAAPPPLAPTAPEPAPPPALPPQRRGTMGTPAAPPLSPLDYVDAYPDASAIETARLRGEITDARAAQLRAGLATPTGMQGQIMASQRAGEREQVDAARALAQREVEAANRERMANEEMAVQRQEQEAEAATQRADFQADYQRRVADYDAAATELTNASVDPKNFWNDKRTAGVFAGTVAMALMSIGAGLKGSVTAGQQMMERALDRDIEAQKATLANRAQGLAARRSALGLAYQRLGDIDAAAAAVKAHAYEQQAMRVERMKSQLTNANAIANADTLVGTLQRRQAEERMGVDMALKQQAQQQAAYAAAARANAGQLPTRKAGPEDEKRFVPFAGGFAPDAVAARKLLDAEAARRSYVANIDRLLALNAGGAAIPGGAKRAEAAAIRAAAIYDTGRLAGAGALAKEELSHFSEVIPDVYDVTTSDAAIAARLNAAKNMVNARVRDMVNTTGITPGVLGTGTDAKGNPQRQLMYLPEEQTPAQSADVPFTAGSGYRLGAGGAGGGGGAGGAGGGEE